MSPLLRRKRTPEPADGEASEASAEAPTAVLTATETAPVAEPAPVPAGLGPEDEIGERPNTRRRGRLRRRLRHLRRVRELMLRDIGGLVYEFHRTNAHAASEAHRTEIVRSKLDRLVGLDAERGQLEDELDDRRVGTVLREPGVGGTCPSCGEYFASDARFCAHCGVRVDERGALAEPVAAEPADAAEPAAHEDAARPAEAGELTR